MRLGFHTTEVGIPYYRIKPPPPLPRSNFILLILARRYSVVTLFVLCFGTAILYKSDICTFLVAAFCLLYHYIFLSLQSCQCVEDADLFLVKPVSLTKIMRGSRNFHERGSNQNCNFCHRRGGVQSPKNPEITFF